MQFFPGARSSTDDVVHATIYDSVNTHRYALVMHVVDREELVYNTSPAIQRAHRRVVLWGPAGAERACFDVPSRSPQSVGWELRIPADYLSSEGGEQGYESVTISRCHDFHGQRGNCLNSYNREVDTQRSDTFPSASDLSHAQQSV